MNYKVGQVVRLKKTSRRYICPTMQSYGGTLVIIKRLELDAPGGSFFKIMGKGSMWLWNYEDAEYVINFESQGI